MTSAELFDKLGGRAVVEAAVADLYRRVLHDPVVAGVFDGVDTDRLTRHMTDFLVASVGGAGQRYRGRDMAVAHAALAITDEMFDRVAVLLMDALTDAGADETAVEDVVTYLGPLRTSIVTC